MYLLRLLALVVWLVPMIANSQILDPNFTAPLPIAKPEIFSVKVQQDGKILLAGDFDQYGNQTRNTLIRLNADGTLDNSFNYSLAGQNSWVNHLELKGNGQIVVSDGLVVHTLESDGTVANTFSTYGEFEVIYTIKSLPDGKTLVAGYSDLTGDFFRRHNADGSVDETFSFSQSLYIQRIDFQNDKIIISDSWGMIMRLHQSGEIDETFFPGPYNSYPVNVMGFFNRIAVQPDGKIIRYTGDDANYDFFYNSVDMIRHAESPETEEAFYDVRGPVAGIKFWDDKIVVQLITENPAVGLQAQSKIIRLNGDGTIDQTFTAINCTFEPVSASFDVAPDGSVIVTNSQYDNPLGINKYDASGAFVSGFNPPLTKIGSIRDVRITSDQKLIVSGNFIKIGNHVTNHVARLMPNGTPDNSFTVMIDRGSALTAEIAANNSVIVSSEFDVFKVDGAGALDASFLLERASDLFQIVKLQVLSDEKIVAIGPNNIYRLLPNGSLDPTFASGTGGGGPNGGRPDFAVQSDGKILYASISSNWNGQPIPRFARINVDGTLDTSFPIGSGPNPNASLNRVIATPSGGFVLNGIFSSFNGRPVTNNLVKVNVDGTFDELFMSNYEALSRKQILILKSDISGLLRATNVGSDETGLIIDIDLIKSDGTLDDSFHLPSALSINFPEDIASDESSIFLAGDMTLNGSQVFIAKLLRKSISITGNTINNVAEDTSFELLPEHIIVDGIEDSDASSLSLVINNGMHYTVDGNTLTPEQNFNGTLIISVTLMEDSQALVSGTISIEITPVNDKPVITGVQNFEILEDQQSTLLLEHLSYTDVDSPATDLSFEISNGDHYTVNGTTILPEQNYYGPIQLNITLSDGVAQGDVFTFGSEVIALNDPPIILSAKKNQKCSQSSPLILSASNFEIADIDSDGGFTISAEPGSGYEIVEGAIVPHSSKQQKLMVFISASDGESASSVFTFEVHVLPSKADDETDARLWPNPATNVVNHGFDKDATIQITSLYGEVVARDDIKTGRIDVSHLRPGVYVFEVTDKSLGRTVYRFIKE